jgi:hypothetical protein
MRLHRILTAAGLTALVCAPLLGPSPAMAWGSWGAGSGVSIPLPPSVRPWPHVAQVPIFGGPSYSQTPQTETTPQTAQVPNGDTANGSPTFFAPGVDRNSGGQLEKSP